MRLSLPSPVLEALARLNARGHAAYAVGGCVRDLLRGMTPHDYDICVSCPPEETHACFAGERVVDTGVQHGTVTVILAGMPLEITTFRTDGAYRDGRHPDSVRFTPDVRQDLARRDFTVNAMAYHPEEGVIDLFDGQKDLKNGILRCVGEAEKRLTEDALRILRALRFAAQLDFEIEENTARAVHALAERLALVSRERIAEELRRMLISPGAARVSAAFPDVLAAALPQAPAEALQAGIALLPALPGGDEVLGLAALICHCSAEVRAAVLRSLKLPRALETQAAQLAALADAPFSVPDTGLYLARMGEDQLRRLLALQRAAGVLSRAEAQQRSCRAADVLAASLPLKANALPVHGEDMKALGLSGPAIGKTLNALHEKVLRGEIACERDALMEEARKLGVES